MWGGGKETGGPRLQLRDAFLEAVKTGEIAQVRDMLVSEPGLVDLQAPSAESAVVLAIYHREDDIARLLVQAGATTDLHEAAALGLTDRVRGHPAADPAKVNAYSVDRWTPLHMAAFFGRRETAEVLPQAGARIDLLSHNRQANMPLHAGPQGRPGRPAAGAQRRGQQHDGGGLDPAASGSA